MTVNVNKIAQYKDLSANDLKEQLAVAAMGLLHARLSQCSTKKRGSLSKQRRHIARLLTHLRGTDC